MKTKEKQTLKAMKKEELVKVLDDARRALEILRVNKPGKNVREGKALTRKIAIVSTLIRQKELSL